LRWRKPKTLSLSTAVAIATFGLCVTGWTQGAAPNLAGTYRCQPQPDKCIWGTTVSITEEGNNKVSLNNEQGSFADAKLTSNITLSAAPPFNANGLIMPNHSIQWSNGTQWVKQ
jgi:hypothetical protein